MRTAIIVAIAILCACPSTARSEDVSASGQGSAVPPDQGSAMPSPQQAAESTESESQDTKVDEIETNEQSAETDFTLPVARRIVKDWSVYDLKYLTFKWGIYLIVDAGRAAQSDASKALLD